MSKEPTAPEPMKPRPIREWTLMFYFASDNPLAPSTVSQLKSLKAAGFHADANVIARFDPFTRNTPSHVYEVNLTEKIEGRLSTGGETSNIGFNARDPFVRNLVLDKIWEDDEDGDKVRGHITSYYAQRHEGVTADMLDLPRLPKGEFHDGQGPRESLDKFLTFCREKYPARHYMLFILGHGVAVGNDIFLFDSDVAGNGAPENKKDDGVVVEAAAFGAEGEARKEKAGQTEPKHKRCDDEPDFRTSLTLRQLGCVLSDFRDGIKKQEEPGEFELVGFHCCSMSGIEVAYELQGTANYMLASQGPAFVGSWPYRQMLLRIFNDIEAMLMPGDLADSDLLAKLRAREGPAAFLREKLSKSTLALLRKHNRKNPPTPELTSAIVRDLNEAPPYFFNGGDSPARWEEAEVGGKSGPTKGRLAKRKFNRARLAEIFGEEKVKERPMANPRNVRHMLTRLFYYVLYNSLDFQLAGYSFDLCLCDLTKVEEVRKPLDDLAKALIKGLRGARGLPASPARAGTAAAKVKDARSKAEAMAAEDEPVPLARELILLAHWDAQSFFQENYTDLYDFCFRLRRRCEHVFPALVESSPEWDAIQTACKEMMRVLEKGTKESDDSDRFIVRAEFAGAAYQYSHGLSIFFPWTRPTDGFLRKYLKYMLVAEVPQEKTETGKRLEGDGAREVEVRVPEHETDWAVFLDKYFTKTERETSKAEEMLSREYAEMDNDEPPGTRTQGESAGHGSVDRAVLDLLDMISAKVFSPVERFAGSTERLDGGGNMPGKTGDTDTAGRPGKTGDTDTSGDGCGCSSIKNYPPFTGMSQGANEHYRLASSRKKR